jgi:hypothetical protein
MSTLADPEPLVPAHRDGGLQRELDAGSQVGTGGEDAKQWLAWLTGLRDRGGGRRVHRLRFGPRHVDVYVGEETGPGFRDGPWCCTLAGAILRADRGQS